MATTAEARKAAEIARPAMVIARSRDLEMDDRRR
jgi:hypothetical protein